MRRLTGFIAVAILLSSCSLRTHTEIEALNEAKTTGSPFTQGLTNAYRAYVKQKQNALDYNDARHFARKGLMSAQGQVVMPEPLSNWHLDEASARDLRAARNELLSVLDAGGRAMAPVQASRAQAKFDCWMEQAEQSWISVKAPSCKGDFSKAMMDLNSRMDVVNPKSEKLGEAVPPSDRVVNKIAATDPTAIDASLDKGMFLVFFDFDKSTLNATGMEVIDAIAAQAKERSNLKSVTITGHTDTRGGDAYNQRLSLRRADAVKTALASRGIALNVMSVSGKGEKELMVETPNNTREPGNRRVEVSFQ